MLAVFQLTHHSALGHLQSILVIMEKLENPAGMTRQIETRYIFAKPLKDQSVILGIKKSIMQRVLISFSIS
jgi:hypothetical protein